MKLYVIYWTRQKGKMKKDGTTHAIAETIGQAMTLFVNTYPDREMESIHKEGDDILGSL